VPQTREADAYQTKVESLVETGINIVIGYTINFFANLMILPAFGFASLTWKTNLLMGIPFTVVSIARQYAIRRWAQDHLRSVKARITKAILR